MIDIFCNVIDNFGDAGFSLRLTRTLLKKNISVCFYCNNLNTLHTIIADEDLKDPRLTLRQWPSPDEYLPSRVVIEAFSCRLPDGLNLKLKQVHSLVIELDYLTAEKFAEDCHQLSSSSDGIDSYFFFPGFTAKTGGVIYEDDFKERIQSHRCNVMDPARLKLSLFSYENPRIVEIFDELKRVSDSASVTVFAGKALNNFNSVYRTDLKAGSSLKLDSVSIKAQSMCSQPEYDELLLTSDLNLVRGEESVVRAMLAGKPFLWQIYVQEDNAHLIKLNSFFDRILEYCGTDDKTKENIEKIRRLHLFYNGSPDTPKMPEGIFSPSFLQSWSFICRSWSDHLLSLGPLTDNLLIFIKNHI